MEQSSDTSLASQPCFSAWVARMRVKYCGGGKSGKMLSRLIRVHSAFHINNVSVDYTNLKCGVN